MPAPPYIAGALRTRFWFKMQAGYTAGVGTYYQYTGGPPAVADVDAICTKLRELFSTNYASFMTTDWSLSQVTARDLSSGMGAEGIDSTAVPGTDANTPLPADACALVNCKIGRNYRGGRPRQYWPFGTHTSLDTDHTFSDAFVAALEAAVAAFETGIVGFTSGTTVIANQANVSLYGGFLAVKNPLTGRYRNVPQYRGTPGYDPVIPPDPIVAYTVNKFIASQRRRIRATGA